MSRARVVKHANKNSRSTITLSGTVYGVGRSGSEVGLSLKGEDDREHTIYLDVDVCRQVADAYRAMQMAGVS